MGLRNKITGQSISTEATRSHTTSDSTELYSVIIHPLKETLSLPDDTSSPQSSSASMPADEQKSKEIPRAENPPQDERLLREIAELKDLLSERTQRDEDLVKRLETTAEKTEQLPQRIQSEIAAGAALTFDKYLKTVLEQRMGDARLELEAFKAEAEDVFNDERLKPRRRALLITLLIVDIIVTLGAAALIVLVKFGII